jgi:hypothetical protein
MLFMKEQFISLLKTVQRDGMDKLINYLENTDFYKAPASTRFHGNHEGGLLEHSLNVYEMLKEKLSHKPYSDMIQASEETIILVTLLHDICKTNFYTVDFRNKKNEDGMWVKEPYYTINDTIPYGHGEKSVMMISKFIDLTMEEMYAIRWHMGFTEPKELYNTISTVYEKFPLALALHEADLEATYLKESHNK